MKYCPSGDNGINDQLILKTHIANYIKDITLTILSAIRLLYFIYVLIVVCRSSKKSFFSRPAFMNWLPIFVLIQSVMTLFAGIMILVQTIEGEGQVICELLPSISLFMALGTCMTGITHYMFTSEFMNTSFALRSTIKGLSIAISDFVNRARSLNG